MANLANTYRKQGRWEVAEQLEIRVIDMRKKLLGPEHPDTLRSMSSLATTYLDQGRWNEAEQLEIQVVDMSKKLLGAEHPDILTSMENLENAYRNQERWDEAEELQPAYSSYGNAIRKIGILLLDILRQLLILSKALVAYIYIWS